MPYGYSNRRYKPKPKYRKKTSYLSGAAKALSIATQALVVARSVKALVNVEYKKFDQAISLTTSGAVQLLNGISQGDTDQLRDGNSIRQTSQYALLTLQGNSALTQMECRILIFKDLQQVADTLPTQAQLLDPDISSALHAPLNNETVGRFKIVYDKRFQLKQEITGQEPLIPIKYYRKTKEHVRYNGTSGGDIQKNGYYIMLIHNGGATVPSLTGNFRTTFIDN